MRGEKRYPLVLSKYGSHICVSFCYHRIVYIPKSFIRRSQRCRNALGCNTICFKYEHTSAVITEVCYHGTVASSALHTCVVIIEHFHVGIVLYRGLVTPG